MMIGLRKFAVPAAAALFLFAAAGCATNRTEIPGSAQLVAEGNERITYQVPRDGTVYIYDDRDRRMVYTGEVRRGQTISINAREDSIMIDDRRATEWDLDPRNRLRVYFDERPGGRVVVEERREIRRD